MGLDTPGRPLTMAWVVPGPLAQLTGGYLYDASIVAGLRAGRHAVRVVELAQRFSPVDPFAALGLIRALANGSWDVVVLDELAHPAFVLGLPALGLRRTRPGLVVVVVHHLRCSEPGSPAARRRAALVERAALARIDLAVCTSQATAATLQSLLRPDLPVAVVPPGCDLHRRPGPDPPHGPGAPPEGTLRALLVAHWTPRKGVLEALRALALAPPGVQLDLVGDPDRDPGYARQVQAELRRPELANRVRAYGRVSSEQLAGLYQRADALLLSSSHEGYGTVLAEALAAALPIVATRVGAVPEVVRDGYEAELVAFGDTAAMARALARLAADPAERRRRATHALERAASLPTWEQACAAFETVLREALDRIRPGERHRCTVS